MTQQYHQNIPLATSHLQLAFEFDIVNVSNWNDLNKKDHQIAVNEACEAFENLLKNGKKIVCRSHQKIGTVTIKDAQSLPRDDPWCSDPSHTLVIEFLYSSDHPQLAIRVLVDLSVLDGVTGARIALHTVEVLEYGKQTVSSTEAFKVNPKFTFGFQHALNFIKRIGFGHLSYFYPSFLNNVSEQEVSCPTNGAGLRAYYAQNNPKRAKLLWYSTNGPAGTNFKKLLVAAQQWKDLVGWAGFFSLINFPPGVSASIVARAEDLTSINLRYANVFVPAGQPPASDIWKILNFVHVYYIFFNNYGRHTIKSNAVATAFTWDWLGMAAPVCGLGCIAINDRLLIWTRWTETGVKTGEKILSSFFGEPNGSSFTS